MRCVNPPGNVDCCKNCRRRDDCDIYNTVTNSRNFEVINARVHTREASTLTFTTVAVSASLLLLGILMGMENPFYITTLLSLQFIPAGSLLFWGRIYELWIFQNLNNLIFWIGLLVIFTGIIYREFTGCAIDDKDYANLEALGFEREKYRYRKQSIVRNSIVRFFFGITFVAWLIYENFQMMMRLDPQSLICQWLLLLAILLIILYLILPPIIAYCKEKDC